MLEFRVVDLASQASAVAHYTRGWARDEVLMWLRQFGEAVGSDRFPNHYRFISACGLHTGFILTEDGELLIVGDHTIYRPAGT